MSESQSVYEPEVLPGADLGEGASAAEAILGAGHTLMRVEHDAMLAVSIQRPRNKQRVLSEALAELEIVPRLAAKNYYVIPYKDKGQTTNVSGPSIKAAMNLAREWGNCSVKAYQVGEDDERIHLQGVFVDLERNIRVERPQAVPKFLRTRDGKRIKLNDQKLQQAIGAGASKAIRNAILNGLPDWLVESYDQKARKIAADQTRQNLSKMIEAFLAEGVTRERLETHIGVALERMSDEQLADLRGIYNAIKDKQISVDEAFAPPEPEAGDEKATATVGEVIGQGAAVTAGTEKAPAEAKPKKSAKGSDEPQQGTLA